MGSSAGRHTMRWDTPNRVYLKALVALGYAGCNIRGEKRLVKFVEKFVPNWRDEFKGEAVKNLDNALTQRADKAWRNDEFPTSAEDVTLWMTAMRDVAARNCSFNFKIAAPVVEPEYITDDDDDIDDSIVRDIAKQKTVVPSAEMIRDSGWDYVDIRLEPMKTSPARAKDFIESIASGRNQAWSEMHTGPRGFLATIIDAWLYWRSKQ